MPDTSLDNGHSLPIEHVSDVPDLLDEDVALEDLEDAEKTRPQCIQDNPNLDSQRCSVANYT